MWKVLGLLPTQEKIASVWKKVNEQRFDGLANNPIA